MVNNCLRDGQCSAIKYMLLKWNNNGSSKVLPQEGTDKTFVRELRSNTSLRR